MSDPRPIGVFDSGMGGLTVMRALVERLTQENIIYLGDTARLPYGTKSADTVSRYALQAANALLRREVKLLVIACNTASSVALPVLQRACGSIPVIGVIEPGAEAAVSSAPEGPVAVIATEGTVKDGAYMRAVRNCDNRITVVQQACPLFVALAEEGLTDGPIAEAVAERYLNPLLVTAPRPKALVLGCTHFPVLKNVISKITGPDITLVDSAETTARAVAKKLLDEKLDGNNPSPTRHFLVTDAPDRFAKIGQSFLGEPINPAAVELIDLQ